MTKTELRQLIRERKAACPPAERAALSQAVIAQLEKHPRWQAANTVLLYHSLPDEVDTHQLLHQWGTRKRILLPAVVGNDLQLRPYSNDQQLEEGAYHILEPATTGTCEEHEDIDLAIIPGMAFTRNGHRLGRGKGYYDRLLARWPKVYKIGICWPFQLVEEIPTEAHDICLDAIITA